VAEVARCDTVQVSVTRIGTGGQLYKGDFLICRPEVPGGLLEQRVAAS
jgi:hypothetical protein